MSVNVDLNEQWVHLYGWRPRRPREPQRWTLLKLGRLFETEPAIGEDWVDAHAHPSYAACGEEVACFLYVRGRLAQRVLTVGEEERLTRVYHRQIGRRSVDWLTLRKFNNRSHEATWGLTPACLVPVLPLKAYSKFQVFSTMQSTTTFAKLFNKDGNFTALEEEELEKLPERLGPLPRATRRAVARASPRRNSSESRACR